MSTNFSNRRKNFYIKKEFQRKFILQFCGLVVAGAVISGAIVYVMSMATVTTTFENSRLTIKTTADYLLPVVLLSGIVVVAVVGLATVFVTLFTSHKIGGALYAIERRVDEVARLNLKTEFNLRAGDEIKPLAVGLNVMVAGLRNGVKEVAEAASELEAAVVKQDPAGIRDRLKNLWAKIGRFDV